MLELKLNRAQKAVMVSSSCLILCYYTPRFNEVKKWVYWFHLAVRLSVLLSICGQNRVRSVSSTILVRSISYLHILWSNFKRCITCKVCVNIQKLKKLKFWQIISICNFDFVFFWLGIQYDSIVWVMIKQWGVSSEHRRSSCSSCFLCGCTITYNCSS